MDTKYLIPYDYDAWLLLGKPQIYFSWKDNYPDRAFLLPEVWQPEPEGLVNPKFIGYLDERHVLLNIWIKNPNSSPSI